MKNSQTWKILRHVVEQLWSLEKWGNQREATVEKMKEACLEEEESDLEPVH